MQQEYECIGTHCHLERRARSDGDVATARAQAAEPLRNAFGQQIAERRGAAVGFRGGLGGGGGSTVQERVLRKRLKKLLQARNKQHVVRSEAAAIALSANDKGAAANEKQACLLHQPNEELVKEHAPQPTPASPSAPLCTTSAFDVLKDDEYGVMRQCVNLGSEMGETLISCEVWRELRKNCLNLVTVRGVFVVGGGGGGDCKLEGNCQVNAWLEHFPGEDVSDAAVTRVVGVEQLLLKRW